MFILQTLLLASALGADGPTTLVQFTAPWCGPCKSMEPTIGRLAQAGHPVSVVDIDQRPDLANRFGVTQIPCFVMVAKGREVDRVVGACSYDRLLRMYAKAPVATPNPRAPNPRAPNPRAIAGGNQPGRLANSPSSARPQVRSAVAGSGPLQTRPVANKAARAVRQTPAGSGSAGNSLPPLKRAMYATVRLHVEDGGGTSYGTGTIVDTHQGDALIMTCAHIFRDSGGRGPIRVDSFAPGAGSGLPGELIAMDMDKDVALVSVSTRTPIAPVPVATSGYRLQPGAAVFSIGCDRGADPSLIRSEITTVNRYAGPENIEVAGEPVVGRSGGGLFNNEGELIGVCNAADPADREGIYASLSLVQSHLASIGLQRLYQRAAPELASNNRQLAGNTRPRTPASTSLSSSQAGRSSQQNAAMVPLQLASNNRIPPASLEEVLRILRENPGQSQLVCEIRDAGGSRKIVLSRAAIEQIQLVSQQQAQPENLDSSRFADRRQQIPPDYRDENGRIIRAQSQY